MTRKWLALIGAIFVVCLAVGCGGGGGQPASTAMPTGMGAMPTDVKPPQ